jgi:glucose-6-phosphate 1-dehydrogenase
VADLHTRLVIFGATGDLAARLPLPALAHLREEDALPDDLLITGVGDQDWDTPRFRGHVDAALDEHADADEHWRAWVRERAIHARADVTDGVARVTRCPSPVWCAAGRAAGSRRAAGAAGAGRAGAR